jgi:hypothetical protein
MADLRVKMAFGQFATEAAHCNLPVGMLNEVSRSSYSFQSGGENEISTWFNTLYFRNDTLAKVDSLSSSPKPGAEAGVQSIYHEATHAWFDIMSMRADAAGVVTRGKTYYLGSLRRSGQKVDDEERAVQEAAAEYVAHRASSYFAAYSGLSYYEKLLDHRPPNGASQALSIVKRVPSEYDLQMADRRMGYQMMSLFSSDQDPLTKPISADLRAFCDRVLLERRIPDSFNLALPLKKMYDALARKFPTLR